MEKAGAKMGSSLKLVRVHILMALSTTSVLSAEYLFYNEGCNNDPGRLRLILKHLPNFSWLHLSIHNLKNRNSPVVYGAWDRQTVRQTDRQTDRQTIGQLVRQTGRYIDG